MYFRHPPLSINWETKSSPPVFIAANTDSSVWSLIARAVYLNNITQQPLLVHHEETERGYECRQSRWWLVGRWLISRHWGARGHTESIILSHCKGREAQIGSADCTHHSFSTVDECVCVCESNHIRYSLSIRNGKKTKETHNHKTIFSSLSLLPSRPITLHSRGAPSLGFWLRLWTLYKACHFKPTPQSP